LKLKDKIIVITGSSRGIGKSIAKACIAEGAKVVISSRNLGSVKKTCNELDPEGNCTSGISADVYKKEDLQKLFEHAIEKFKKIDIWINNAGIGGGYMAIDEMSYEEIEHIVNVNLIGILNACKLIIPYFIKKGSGIILNMSGRGGKFEAAPFQAVYAATKVAIVSTTKSMAAENKNYPISIHAINPGMVETDILKNVKSGPKSNYKQETLKYVLNAFGTPIDIVGKSVAAIVSQVPGKKTGEIYSLMNGLRMVRSIALIIYYRISKKI
jgi:NAD(P)-dependent dehydrogenase (short-subunit alcohol dehydrogenase family)